MVRRNGPQNKKKPNLEDAVAAMAAAMDKPVSISLENPSDILYRKKFEKFDVSDRVTETSQKWMDLEDKLLDCIKTLKCEVNTDNRERIMELEARLKHAKDRIRETLAEL